MSESTSRFQKCFPFSGMFRSTNNILHAYRGWRDVSVHIGLWPFIAEFFFISYIYCCLRVRHVFQILHIAFYEECRVPTLGTFCIKITVLLEFNVVVCFSWEVIMLFSFLKPFFEKKLHIEMEFVSISSRILGSDWLNNSLHRACWC